MSFKSKHKQPYTVIKSSFHSISLLSVHSQLNCKSELQTATELIMRTNRTIYIFISQTEQYIFISQTEEYIYKSLIAQEVSKSVTR